MRKGLLLGITAILSFVVFLALYAPAGVAYRFFKEDVDRLPDTSIFRVGGTIWQGSADIRYRDFPGSRLDWSLAAFPLFSRITNLTLEVVGLGHELSANLLTDGKNADITGLQGSIQSDYINHVSSRYGLRFSGMLELDSVNLTVEDDWFANVQGNIHWTGGSVLYQTGNGSQSVNLPPLDGELSTKDNRLTLLVENSRLPVLSIHLQQDGWVELRFNARLLALADLPLPKGTNPDEVVLTIEEKVL